MRPNVLGMSLTVGVGVGVFAVWLFVCYPATAKEVADKARESFSWLVLITFVVLAIACCTMSAQMLHNLLLALRSSSQAMVVLTAIGVGFLLWQHYTAQQSDQAKDIPNVNSPSRAWIETTTDTSEPSGYWWEQDGSQRPW